MKSKLDKISYAEPPQKVFRDIEHYKKVRAAITKALSTSKARRTTSGESSYLLNRLVIQFSSKFEEEQIYLDYANGQVVLEAPRDARESKSSLSQRRMSYYGNLIRSVEAMATIGITHIYLVLEDAGRFQLEKTRIGSSSKRGKKR